MANLSISMNAVMGIMAMQVAKFSSPLFVRERMMTDVLTISSNDRMHSRAET